MTQHLRKCEVCGEKEFSSSKHETFTCLACVSKLEPRCEVCHLIVDGTDNVECPDCGADPLTCPKCAKTKPCPACGWDGDPE